MFFLIYRGRTFGIFYLFILSFFYLCLLSLTVFVAFWESVWINFNVFCCSLWVLSMPRGFTKALTSPQKQTDALPWMNILNTSKYVGANKLFHGKKIEASWTASELLAQDILIYFHSHLLILTHLANFNDPSIEKTKEHLQAR